MTHLVAAKDGSDKALAARKIPGCVLVRPAWLVECYCSMTRRDVEPHLMGRGVVDTIRPDSQPMNVNSSEGTSDSDSDSDDLGAELEKEMMQTD